MGAHFHSGAVPLSVYAIGDLQGCFEPLQRLLEKIAFDNAHDQLWFVGDLVNRGPQSLRTLRFVRELGDAAVTVLGNHDLHLLAMAAGVRPLRRKDTFADVLAAPDRDILLDWLRRRPLLHRQQGFTMVHAGIPPQWDIEEATARARELEAALRSDGYRSFLEHMYGDQPPRWNPRLQGWDRLRFITNGLTRIRYCDGDGNLDMATKCAPGDQPPGLMPWFQVPGCRTRGEDILIGHWGTLQYLQPLDPDHRVHHLETGCAFGLTMTAMRLEDRRLFSVECA